MINSNISAYIIPIDEYSRLAWISGFTGSNGKAIVTLEKVNNLVNFLSMCEAIFVS
jgi:hypothetical protein